MKYRLFRKSLSSFLAFALFTSPLARANEYMDKADEAVKAAKVGADNFAVNLVTADFNNTLSIILKRVEELQKQDKRVADLIKQMDDLYNNLKVQVEKDYSNIALNKDTILKLEDEFVQLYRKRFDLSWVPSEVAKHYQALGPVLIEIARSFENFCVNGRSDRSFKAGLPQSPPPPPFRYAFRVSLGATSPDQMTSYEPYDYHVRNDVLDGTILVSAGVFTLSGSVLLTSAVFGGVGATALAAASIAFPIAAAVLVVAIAISYFSSQARMREVADQYSAAEVHKFKETARDDYIAQKYRAECSKLSIRFNELAEAISKAEANPASTKKPETSKDPKMLWETVKSDVAYALGTQQKQVMDKLNTISFAAIDEYLEMFYSKVLSIIKMAKKANQLKAGSPDSLIEEDLKLTRRFETMRSQFTTLLSQSIDVTFLKLPKSVLAASVASFEKEFLPFAEKYRHVSEVSSLSQTFAQFKKSENL